MTPLQQATRGLSFDLESPALGVLASIVREGRAARLRPCDLFPLHQDFESDDCREAMQVLERLKASAEAPSEEVMAALKAARDLFVAPEMAVAPLLSKDGVIGIVLADNLYSQDPINDDDVQLLDTLAQQAGLTIDNALAYQRMQEAQRSLLDAERLATVGNMAARVSHEIRNPLATIGGFARSILKKPGDEEKVTQKIGIIVDEVTRLEELLGDLLDMARPRQLNWEPHNVNEVVSHALLLADADIKAAGVTLKTEMATDIPPLLLDRSRLLQAVLNIVRNGSQAMADKSGVQCHNEGASTSGGEGDSDGSCTMTVSTRLLAQATPPTLEIEVRDQGVGISERAVKQIFNPFFSTKVSGSGLGLAVTRRILQDHGGDIDVESEENVGTTFYLRIPARLPESAQEAASEAEKASE
jgi:signal transduction histidine kinase